MAVPIAPIIKRGPELLQNESRRSASTLERLPLLYKSFTHTAPKGNPLKIPKMNATAPAGATLNRGRIILSLHFEMTSAKPEYMSRAEHTKKGNNEGIIIS